MVDDPIGDELHKLSEEFRKLAGLPAIDDGKTNKEQVTKNNISILMSEFSLTYNQAKTWLEQEPNYFTIRRIFTERKSDNNLTEPTSVYKSP